MRVMVAGIAGASLGTEIAKSLCLAGQYEVFGCDISQIAFGHFDTNFAGTFVIDRDNYIASLISTCVENNIRVVVAGAEKTMVLIAENEHMFEEHGIRICQNNSGVISMCNNKDTCFKALGKAAFAIPMTRRINRPEDLDGFPVPCVIKPALNSGGSVYVFYAETRLDAEIYCTYLIKNSQIALAQEYIPHDLGEFTVGVLSMSNGDIVGSIALKRSFASKLSVAARGDNFLISSGYSQGEIRDFPDVRRTAEAIARSIGSTGPINVQGRVNSNGVFVPFEINPRFSATTFLRALAGFNEVDFLIRHLNGRNLEKPINIKEGWYLRSLTETYVQNIKAIS